MTLKLPTPIDVTGILEMCIGQDPILKEGGTPLDLTSPPKGTYVSWLKTDSGEIMGAILASLPAVAFLGGTMIMIPAGGQEDQVKAGTPSDAIVDSMEEINNMLRSLLNKVQENDHVSPSAISQYSPPAEDSTEAWIFNAGSRVDLVGQYSFGEGHLTILSRDG